MSNPILRNSYTTQIDALVDAHVRALTFGASGVGHKAGTVPDPGAVGGTTKFLREDGTWQTPAGGGTVTAVTASVPVASSGGATPNITITDFVGSGVGHARGTVPDPGAAAGTTKFLREDGSWQVPSGGGTVTAVTASSPLASSGGATPNLTIALAKADGATLGAAAFATNDFNDNGSGIISIDYTNGQASDSTHKGFLTSTDWSTFNGKQAALSLGNLTETTSSILTITGGTGATVGNVTVAVTKSDSTHNGYLSSTDWNTFNGKQPALGFTPVNKAGDSGIGELQMLGAAINGAPATANCLTTQALNSANSHEWYDHTGTMVGNMDDTGSLTLANGLNTTNINLSGNLVISIGGAGSIDGPFSCTTLDSVFGSGQPIQLGPMTVDGSSPINPLVTVEYATFLGTGGVQRWVALTS